MALEVVFELGWFTVDVQPGTGRAPGRIVAPGLGVLRRDGRPDLPVRGVLLGIPPSGQPIVDVVEDAAATFEHRLRLEPAEGAEGGVPGPESAAYDPPAVAAVTDIAWVRGQRVLRLEFRPFQYRDADGALRVHRRIAVRIDLAKGGAVAPPRGTTGDPAADDVLAGTIANAAAARAWRVERGPRPHDLADRLSRSAEAGAGGPADDQARWNLGVDADGMYRVTGSDLALAGMAIETVHPDDLRLYNGGREVAVRVTGAGDGRVDPEDALVFYGEATASKYTTVNVYQLAVGPGAGRRMAVRARPPGAGAVPAAFTDTLKVAENRRYVSDKPDLPAGESDPPGVDRWYWDQLAAPATLETVVPLADVATGGGPAAVSITVVGKSDLPDADPDHRLNLVADGTQVGAATWDGDNRRETVTFTVPGLALADGALALELVAPGLPGVAYDQFYVDDLTVAYPRQYRLRDGRLAFDVPAGGGDVELRGLATGGADVYDVTDPAAPVALDDLVAVPGGGAGDTGVRFHHGLGLAAAYVAVEAPAYRRAAVVARAAPALREAGMGADMIIVAPPALMLAMAPLAAHRAAASVRVETVDVQRVYDAFGGGVADPSAIRAFLGHAYATWSAPPPAYVLLVGDATNDPRRYLPDSRPTLLPTFLVPVDPWLGEVASDHPFATVSGDDPLPDLFVGRLTVGGALQAGDVSDKILAYEADDTPGDWRRRLLFAADDPDAAGDFHAVSDAVARDHVPAGYDVEAIYHGRNFTDRAQTRAAIVSALNAGNLLTHYVGHGRTTSWGAENLLRRSDVLTLTNDRRLPVLLDMTCLTGYFIDPVTDSISESAVTLSGGGAIAAFSPTGFGVATGHDYLDRGFLDALLVDGVTRLGPVTAASKVRLYTETTVGRDLLDTFVLLGDPALVVPVPFRPSPSPTATATAGATATGTPGPGTTTPGPSMSATAVPGGTPDPSTATAGATASVVVTGTAEHSATPPPPDATPTAAGPGTGTPSRPPGSGTPGSGTPAGRTPTATRPVPATPIASGTGGGWYAAWLPRVER